MKKLLSAILAALLISTTVFTPIIAFAGPFDDEKVVIDSPSLNPESEPISVTETLGDLYDTVEDSFDANGSNSDADETDNGGLETTATKYIGGEAAENADEADRLDSNAFDGEGTQFEGNDGSTTTAYDNGAVMTVNSDGTKEGVDENGTYVTVDKDGNETYHFDDGSIGVKYTDGRKEQIYEDGSKLIYNADGSMSTYESAGYYTDLDDEGNVTSIYFENGQRINIYDENGEFVNQEVTIQGDNGETFTYKFDASTDEDGAYNVNEFSFTANGNGVDSHITAKSDGDGNYSFDIKAPDGSTFAMSKADGVTSVDARSGDGVYETHAVQSDTKIAMTVKDEDGVSTVDGVKTENGESISISMSNGNSVSVTYDNEGKVISGEMKNADGSVVKKDENGTEISIAESGLYIKKDKDGNITSAHFPLDSGASYDFSDGTGVFVDEDNDTKVTWTHDEDGNLVIASPSGDYTVDKDGNLYKDGEPVKYGGKFVNTETGLSSETASEEATEPEETTEPETEPEETGLPASKVAGTYKIKGSVTWTDEDGTETEPVSGTLTVSAVDDTTLAFDDGVNGKSRSSYNPETGKASGFTDSDGAHCSFSFTEKDGEITISMTYSYSEDGLSGNGSAKGPKQ